MWPHWPDFACAAACVAVVAGIRLARARGRQWRAPACHAGARATHNRLPSVARDERRGDGFSRYLRRNGPDRSRRAAARPTKNRAPRLLDGATRSRARMERRIARGIPRSNLEFGARRASLACDVQRGSPGRGLGPVRPVGRVRVRAGLRMCPAQTTLRVAERGGATHRQEDRGGYDEIAGTCDDEPRHCGILSSTHLATSSYDVLRHDTTG